MKCVVKRSRCVIFFSPVVSYNTSLDLYKEIYENSTTLVFEVIAIDNGTVLRGSSATVNITISNTCLLDARYTNTEYKITINDTTGELLLRIPKYYVYPYGESMQNKPHYKKRLDNIHRFLHIFFFIFFFIIQCYVPFKIISAHMRCANQ